MTETSMAEWWDLVNALLYNMQFVRVLDDKAVEEYAQHLVVRTELDLTPAQEHALLVNALRSDERLTERFSKHSEEAVRDFLGRVVARMEAMRPWPTPPYQALPPERWADFADARPIGRIGTWYVDVQTRLRKVFWGLPDDERGTSVLMLRLCSGEEVALVGPWWPDSDDVAVLTRDADRAAETLAAFLDATGFTADEVAPVAA
ncbi:hypothetical protein [Thermomonospora cellulosilytica]|uniref:Uncharacterized protein n=1 Tax=Thermomonospora cellulosilytica TaxID=1411118 RepID=A0A7W3MTV9_9ACTN|nr:hypothetical protein [Thermomonospora cellulosilytica]MBA9001812.1 hypothetical protein [Thermomonospora cellulosilytica]